MKGIKLIKINPHTAKHDYYNRVFLTLKREKMKEKLA